MVPEEPRWRAWVSQAEGAFTP